MLFCHYRNNNQQVVLSSLQQGYFPARTKEANDTPIYKKEDRSSPSNYRPISLLSCIGKAMERCVHKHLYNYISQELSFDTLLI